MSSDHFQVQLSADDFEPPNTEIITSMTVIPPYIPFPPTSATPPTREQFSYDRKGTVQICANQSCGREFVAKLYTQRFCCRLCKRVAGDARLRQWRAARGATKAQAYENDPYENTTVCAECGKTFCSGHGRKYCSNTCAGLAHKRQVLASQRRYAQRQQLSPREAVADSRPQ